MARPLRFQYPGATYHVMARGDGGKDVFESKEDRQAFMLRLEQVCASHGWRTHAWVLMSNHFHLLLETPQPNLVSGMKWLLGTYSQGWNRARGRHGHVFQGRYKSVPVSGSEADGSYFRIVADYIHLNPARAGLAGGKHGKLVSYQWSSLPAYAKGKGPDWLVSERVLGAFNLSQDGRGRRAYVAWLEARAANDGGKIDDAAMQALRRGWYLGKETFKDRLLKLIERGEAKAASGRSRSGAGIREHGQKEAERIVCAALKELGVRSTLKALDALAKGDERKSLVACLVREHTSVTNDWIASRLRMGHPGSVSRQIGVTRKSAERMTLKRKLTERVEASLRA